MKSQVGTEYIVVYGIILLTIVIIGGSLYSLGVFNAGSGTKKVNTGLNNFVVIDWKAEKSNESVILNDTKKITIYNPNNYELTDFQVEMNISYQNGMKSNFSDIKFEDGDGNTIPYWIEEKVDGEYAIVWIKVPYIPANGGDATVYMYWGNPNAISESNGSAVFDFFDGFNGDELNTSKWWISSGASATESNGELCVSVSGDNTYQGIIALKSFEINKVQAKVRIRARTVGSANDNDISVGLSSKNNEISRFANIWLGDSEDSSQNGDVNMNGNVLYSFNDNRPSTNYMNVYFRFVSGDIRVIKGSEDTGIINYTHSNTTGYITIESDSSSANGFCLDYIFVYKYAPSEPTYQISNIELNTPKELIIQLSPKTYSVSNVAVKVKYNGVTNDCSAPPTMHQGEKYEVKCIIPNSGSLKPGDPYRVEVSISYTNAMSGLKHEERGIFSGVIE